jgi:hypothetical protein
MANDIFGAEPAAHALAFAIRTHRFRQDESRAIAVVGGWGSGKSWLLTRARSLIAEEEAPSKASVVSVLPTKSTQDGLPGIVFNAWEAEKSGDIVQQIAVTVAREAKIAKPGPAANKLVESLAKNVGAITTAAGLLPATGFDARLALFMSLVATANSIRSKFKDLVDAPDPVRSAREDFRRLCALICEAPLDQPATQRVLLVVEDLDRCSEDSALRLLDALKLLVLDQNHHVVVVIPINWTRMDLVYQSRILSSGAERYGILARSESYLEKIFSLRLDVPLPHLGLSNGGIQALWGRHDIASTTLAALLPGGPLSLVAPLATSQATPRELDSFFLRLRMAQHRPDVPHLLKSPIQEPDLAKLVGEVDSVIPAALCVLWLHRERLMRQQNGDKRWLRFPADWTVNSRVRSPEITDEGARLWLDSRVFFPAIDIVKGKTHGRLTEEDHCHIGQRATIHLALQLLVAGL